MYGGGDRDATLTRIEREMAATVAEFERGLRMGAPNGAEKLGEGRYRIEDGGVTLDVHIRPHGERRIGMLALSLLWVVYEFQRGDADARRRLLARLDLAMQRGGG